MRKVSLRSHGLKQNLQFLEAGIPIHHVLGAPIELDETEVVVFRQTILRRPAVTTQFNLKDQVVTLNFHETDPNAQALFELKGAV